MEASLVKIVHIKLKRACLGTRRETLYTVEQLKNAASVNVGARMFRVGDDMTAQDADKLCEVKNYEVTINV